MAVCFGAVILGVLAWLGGHLASLYTGNGWAGPALSWDNGIRLVKEGPEVFWPGVPPTLVWGITGGLALVLFFAGVYFYASWAARQPIAGEGLSSMASDADVAKLAPAGVAKRAVTLRHCLKGVDPKRVPPNEAGLMLGTHQLSGTPLRASWEDVVLEIMAPRAGKTSSAVGLVLDAPGAVLATSNKSDLLGLTGALRAKATGQKVWIFDPQQVARSRQEFYWNPLRGVDRVEAAQRLARQFSIGMKGEKPGSDFWLSAGEEVLTGLFLAAGSTRGDFTLEDVQRWLARSTDPLPVQLLREYGHRPTAEALAGAQAGAVETREGIWQTARTMARCLADPEVMRWVTPPKGRSSLQEFKTAGFADTKQTLYLLAKDSVAGGAGPLVAGFVDRMMQDAVTLAEGKPGGRLDPPLVACLDEMCNLPVADLPSLYSHLGSRGVVPIGIAQSWSQIVGVWGKTPAEAMWGASTVKLIGAGIDQSSFLEELSRLIGEHDVTVRSLNYSQRNFGQNLQVRRQRILPPEAIRAMPEGTAVVFATGTKAAPVRLDRWFDGPRRAEIARAAEDAGELLAERAG